MKGNIRIIIISWNCNGTFRENFKVIIKLNYNIAVIQECENSNCLNLKKCIEFSFLVNDYKYIDR